MIATHDGVSSAASFAPHFERLGTESCCRFGTGILFTAQVQVYIRPCSINEFLAPKNLDECIPCEPDNYNLDVSAVRSTASVPCYFAVLKPCAQQYGMSFISALVMGHMSGACKSSLLAPWHVPQVSCKRCPDDADCRNPDPAACTDEVDGACPPQGYLVPQDGYWHSSFFSEEVGRSS